MESFKIVVLAVIKYILKVFEQLTVFENLIFFRLSKLNFKLTVKIHLNHLIV